MKVYVNRRPKTGPWGGGAKTVNKLVEHLQTSGHTVVYQLQEGIDVLFCFDPRPNEFGESINHMYSYRKIFPNAKIIQRVGDVGTHSKPELTDLVRYCLDKSDHFIFPSAWAKGYINFTGDNSSVIYNCPMKEFYKNRNERKYVPRVPRVVTHHWSTNPKKGFDLYKKFEEYCKETNMFEFHYIGQLPNRVSFSGHTPPISVENLTEVLPRYDIYLTASEEEAGANHVLEGIACGLPVVYRNSGGSIVEYCDSVGEEYADFDEMIWSLATVRDNYSVYKQRCLQYSDTNDMVVEKYLNVIRSVYDES